MDTFGSFFKQKRISLDKSLRQFCEDHGLDAGNISKLERDKLPAPISEDKLKQYARFLGINDVEWCHFKDLAAMSAGRIPPEIASDKELLSRLPIFFRTLKDKKFTEDELQELIKRIKES